MEQKVPRRGFTDRVRVRIYFAPPDQRRRDPDNLMKALFDGLTYSRFWADDSQVDDFRVIRCWPMPGGKVVVIVETLNDDDCPHIGGPDSAQ